MSDRCPICDNMQPAPAECDALRAQVAELREALAAWVWAHEYKGSPAGDSRTSLLASELAIARANQELIEEARRKSAVLLSTPPDGRTRDVSALIEAATQTCRAHAAAQNYPDCPRDEKGQPIPGQYYLWDDKRLSVNREAEESVMALRAAADRLAGAKETT